MIAERVTKAIADVLRMVEAEQRTEQACAETLAETACHPDYIARRRKAAARLGYAAASLRGALAILRD